MTSLHVERRAATAAFPALVPLLALAAGCTSSRSSPTNAEAPRAPELRAAEVRAMEVRAAAPLGKAYEETVPVSTRTLPMVPIPGPTPLWMSATEVTWDLFDVYVYKKDALQGKTTPAVDAVTRPSQPYNPMDRGFGHAGYPAISMSFKNAQGFCAWLSAQTGRTYRLPTEAEWERAARAGESGAWPGGSAASLGEHAWTAANSPDKTQPVGTKKANAFGLFDVLGNAGEWCVGPDGKGVLRGGHFKSAPEAARFDTRELDSPDWNLHDPQIPKSKFWLIDGGFVGFRVVCDGPAPDAK